MKNKIIVLAGGGGSEHEVSLKSAENVFQSVNAVISEDSLKLIAEKIVINKISDLNLNHLKEFAALVFIVIHGTNGEDGVLQKLFDDNNIKYVGSGVDSLVLTYNKEKTQDLLHTNGLRVPLSTKVTSELQQREMLDFIGTLNFPIIIKPNTDGSSVSLYKITDNSKASLDKILEILDIEFNTNKRTEMLVQEFVSGREFTCGVVNIKGCDIALEPTEVILTKGEVFDYKAKYTVNGCSEITPADIPPDIKTRIQEVAMRVHDICACKDISRTDMILDKGGNIIVLEINTIPGMTSTSFIPAELAASGFTIDEWVRGMLTKYGAA